MLDMVRLSALSLAPQPGKVLDREHMRRILRETIASEHFATPIDLSVEIVDRITRGPSGKAIRVINRVGQPAAAAMA